MCIEVYMFVTPLGLSIFLKACSTLMQERRVFLLTLSGIVLWSLATWK